MKHKDNCEQVFEYLRSILYDDKVNALQIDDLEPAFEKLGKGMQYLEQAVREMKEYSAAISVGNLSVEAPPRENFLCKNLKNIHANLNHLSWQAKQVAKGDYSQSVSYLDPLMKVGEQVAGGKERISLEKSRKALARYGLDKEVDHMYPFELSGGMARRVLIGTAVVEQPQLVIADEPTPGLHMEAALRVLSHFREIADQGAGVLLITHDLELALKTADKIVVFYAGTAVEEADTVDFNREAALRHPYTRALFRAMPEHGFAPEPGIQPYVRDLPEGCPYGPRCPKYKTECSKEVSYVPYQGGLVRCICPGDENEILPGILSGPAGLKGQMTSEQITSEQMASGQRSGEYNAWGKEGVSL